MTERPTDANRWPALIIICLGYPMIELDVTIVGVALPSIRGDFGVSASSLAWVATHTYSPSAGSCCSGSMHPPRP